MTAISDIISLGIKGPQGQIKVNMASSMVVMEDGVTSLPAFLNAIQKLVDEIIAGAPNSGGGMIPAGHIAMLPFRYNQLPSGWYFCNGTRYANTSPQGLALNSLPATLKSDWGISNNGSTTSVPNWFYGGRGPVMRAVDGSSRQVGSVEDGAIQNITGSFYSATYRSNSPQAATGVFTKSVYMAGVGFTGNDVWDQLTVYIDGSRQIATANEVRMLNRGMTPAIFLGV